MFELISEMLRYFGGARPETMRSEADHDHADDDQAGYDYKDVVRLNIKRLEAPGGRIPTTDGLVLWDGDVSRWRAAEALGQPGNVRAVPSLMRALHDPSHTVRLKAIRALGEIGDERPVKALIPLLGQRVHEVRSGPGPAWGYERGRDLGDVAAESLTSLGEGPLVNAVDEALSGNTRPLCDLAGAHRKEIIEAILGTLRDPNRRVFGEAFRTLADLGAVETLPTLRKKAEEIRILCLAFEEPKPRYDDVARMCQDAISDLESLQSLPRPAMSPANTGKTLPRATTRARTDPPTLPRSAIEETEGPPE